MSEEREERSRNRTDSRVGGTVYDEQYRGKLRKLRARHQSGPTAGSFQEADKHARIGRFVILERLGQGGMGLVYSAYDPNLDRRVALKLIRPGGSGKSAQIARNRLLREAQALARLSHPHIVPVHDVGVIDDRVFVVMEYVDGQTLRTWAKSETRSWQEILAIYRQAGEGLAAAHQLGVVHRDFKPDNALVGKDMRVRVIDFGLARAFRDESGPSSDQSPASSPPSAASRSESKPSRGQSVADAAALSGPRLFDELDQYSTISDSLGKSGAPQLDDPLTATRAVIGTPGYMSPEQWFSARVGPATDQFSFCVSLFEALYGQRPFAGKSSDELRESMLLDRVLPPGENSKVPGWVHAVLCRGLKSDPAARYPSMQALLAELARDVTRARRRWPMLAILGIVAVTSSVLVLRAIQTDAPACQGAAAEVARIWNPLRGDQVRAAFLATGSAYAQQSLTQVTAALDRYASDWAQGHTEACRAHQRGEQSGDLLDRRMSCLDRRLDALNSTVVVLGEATAASLPNMVEVVQRLAPLDACADTEALMAAVPPPDSPALASEVEALRERLHRAEALEHSGRYAEARAEVVDIVSRAEPLAYRPFLAEALLVHGRILLELDQHGQAAETLQRAAVAALAADMKAVAAEAIARLIYVQGMQKPEEGQRALVLVPYAEALLARAPGTSFVHALLLNNTGAVHMARGEREQALEYFERALAIKEREPDEHHIELIYMMQNLAIATPDMTRRRELMQRVLHELERELGQLHPMALRVRLIYGRYVTSPVQARDILATVCDHYGRYHPALSDKRFECHNLLGSIHGELGDARRAAEHLSRAAELTEARSNARETIAYTLAQGYARYFQGDYQAAEEAFQSTRATAAGLPAQWWWQLSAAEADLGIGLARLAMGRAQESIASLEAAVRVLEEVIQLHQDSVLERELALARLSLARALTAGTQAGPAGPGSAARKCDTRAWELLARADAWYRSAGPGVQHRLDEIEQLRRQRLAACR